MTLRCRSVGQRIRLAIGWRGSRDAFDLLATWRESLPILQPETVIAWHHRGWRWYWRRRAKAMRIGKPPVGWKRVRLIQRVSRDDPLWRAPRTADELAVLGHEVGDATIARSMAGHRPPQRGQRWSTSLADHVDATIAYDSFTVPTVTFRNLFVFVVLHQRPPRILHTAVTEHPTAEWTARQIAEAMGPDANEAKMLVRDRDSIQGAVLQRRAEALDLRQIVRPEASPWCNGFAQQVIEATRRECNDHIIPLGRRHLTRVLRESIEYDDGDRCHPSLHGDAPAARRCGRRKMARCSLHQPWAGCTTSTRALPDFASMRTSAGRVRGASGSGRAGGRIAPA